MDKPIMIIASALFLSLSLLGYKVLVPSTSTQHPPTVQAPTQSPHEKLQVNVVNEDQQSLEGVTVTVTSDGPTKAYITNTFGYISFQLLTSSRKVTVSLLKNGYEPITDDIDLAGEAHMSKQYVLKKTKKISKILKGITKRITDWSKSDSE